MWYTRIALFQGQNQLQPNCLGAFSGNKVRLQMELYSILQYTCDNIHAWVLCGPPFSARAEKELILFLSGLGVNPNHLLGVWAYLPTEDIR